MFKSVNPYLLITISLFLLLFAPLAIQDGMFMDGTLYASVAKNLANGKGTFWYQTFSETVHANFHEQLPVFGFLESLFFRLFGDSIYTEFIFQLVLALLAMYLFIKIWKIVFEEENIFYSWLPIFCWSILPVVFWSYINNVQETLMIVFAMSSIYYMLCAIKLKSKVFINLTLSAILIFLCSFCKGVQGMFPIVAILFFWFSYRTISFKKAVVYSLYMFLIIGVIAVLLLTNETSYNSLEAYFNSRIIGTFTNDYSKVTPNRLYLLLILIQELIPVFIFAILIVFISKISKQKIQNNYRKSALFFLLIAISGSLPLMVTLEQRNFYLCTSLPFYALSIAALILPYIKVLIKKEYPAKLKKVSYVIFVIALITPLFFIGKIHRDKEKLSDIYIIGDYIGHGEIIAIHPEIHGDFSTMMYFSRYFEISVDRHSNPREYYLTYKDLNKAPDGYNKVDKQLLYFNLYKK